MQSIESRRRRNRGQSGFTLIELLVVIAILGVLAGVVVFAVGGVTDTAQSKACDTEEKTIETALEAFRADSATNVYPSAAQGLAVLTPDYLRKDPSANWTYTDPGSGNVGDATLVGKGECL